MTVKNIFVYKLFLSLNVSNFSLFLCKNCNSPDKGHSLLSQEPPLKMEILSTLPPPFFFGGNLVGGSIPPQQQKGEGVLTMLLSQKGKADE